MNPFHQVFAIARTDFRFGLRRGAPVVPLALIGLVLNISIWMITSAQVSNFKADMQYNFYGDAAKLQRVQALGIHLPTIADQADSINTDGLMGRWTFYYILSLLLLVAAVAPAVPADRQFGVMELLRSLPLGGGRYLAGKILGVLAAACLAGVIPLLTYLAISWILVGAISYKLVALLVLLDGLPLLVAGISLGIFAGTPLGRRTYAAACGFMAGILGLGGLILASKDNPYLGGGFLTPAAAYILRLVDTSSMPHPPVSAGEVMLFYGVTSSALALLAVLARLWLRWRENF